MQAAGLTDLEDYLEQVDFHSRHVVYIKVAINPLLLKQNDTMSA